MQLFFNKIYEKDSCCNFLKLRLGKSMGRQGKGREFGYGVERGIFDWVFRAVKCGLPNGVNGVVF